MVDEVTEQAADLADGIETIAESNREQFRLVEAIDESIRDLEADIAAASSADAD
jgi:hypothetical protein